MRCLFILLFLALATRAEAAAPTPAAVEDPHELIGAVLSPSTSYLSLTSFPEHLVYNVSWGLIPVGQATMEVRELVSFAGRPAYHVISTAKSNAFCDTFYKVRDLNESWIDATTLSSLGYLKKLREGRYVRDEWVLYDPTEKHFLSRAAGKDGIFSVSGGTIPASVQDILSSLYFVRSKDLAPGSDIILDVNTRQNWPLVVRVLRKEKVRTPAGSFATILVEPAIRQEGIFIQKGRHLQVWLSDDARKIPVKMSVEVFFGHIAASLAKAAP
jgi:hypothetical protein